MTGLNFMQAWAVLTGSLAMIALILTAFWLMLGIVRPADAFRRVATILGFVMLLMVLRAVLVNIWSACRCGNGSLWPRLESASGNGGDHDDNPGKNEMNEVPD